MNTDSLRPRGRSGLKYIFQVQFGQFIQSPSSRAEWVEIPVLTAFLFPGGRLRPRGRSGLKLRIPFGLILWMVVSVLAGGVG